MKLIIFDIDGTLSHSRRADDNCYTNAFRKAYNIEVKNTDWNSYKHVTDYYVTFDILEQTLNRTPTRNEINTVITHYINELKQYLAEDKYALKEIPGAVELINHLNSDKKNYIVGIVTGGFLETAEFKLNTLGFDIPPNRIYTSDKFSTKHEMICKLIETEGSIQFNKIFYVGDRKYDYLTAKVLNINFIGIDYDKNNKLKDLGAKNVIEDYKPMEKFLDML